MTRFDPSLFVQRLVVFRKDTIVYDERFHLGVNVIRGENSSGKSTVLNFIYYALGGDLTQWSEAALLCTRVVVEVKLSGIVATVSRDVMGAAGAAMEIYGGDCAEAMKASRLDWIRYPYRKSPSQESFSQAIFRLLGMPEVISESTGNVTVHQMMRLLYADQLSPVDDLFRFERFDQQGLRDTVGRLLCGAYSSDLYANELRIKALSKEHDELSGELRGLLTVLGQATAAWVDAERHVATEKLRALQGDVENAERELYGAEGEDRITLAAQEGAYTTAQQLQERLLQNREAKDRLAFTMSDAESFIRGLKQKIENLKDAALTASHVGDVHFHTCPACYAELETDPAGVPAIAHACHLCKSPFDTDRARTRIAGLINEAAIQVKQSEQLQLKRSERMRELREQSQLLQRDWDKASVWLATLQRLPSGEKRQRLRELHKQAGYLQRQLEDLDEKAKTASLAAELTERKASLNAEITRRKDENESLRASQQATLSRAYTMMSKEIRDLLHADLLRQDTFENAEHVEFTFSDNRIVVDGQTYFSASSRAILKSSFCLGFMAAAARADFFRHPRFCMIDVLENMGVEVQRSHNFQIQILRTSESLKAEHQIIYATAMIAPELDDERFTIGRFSTRDERTIADWQ